MLPTRRAAVVFFITLSELVSSRGDPPELKHPVHGHVIPDAWPTIKRAESAPKRVAVRRARLVFILHAATDAREILPVLEALMVEDEVPFKTIAMASAATLLPRHQDIGPTTLCIDEASAEASLLQGAPEVAVIGISTAAELKLAKVLHGTGCRLMGFHGSFFAPSPAAKQMLPFLDTLLLPHKDLEKHFGPLPQGLRVRITGSPVMERIQMEHLFLNAKSFQEPRKQHPDLAFLRGASDTPVVTYFDVCKGTPDYKGIKLGRTARSPGLGAGSRAGQHSTSVAELLGEANAASAGAREEFVKASGLLGDAVQAVVHTDGVCPSLGPNASHIALAPDSVAATLLMSVSSLVVSAPHAEAPLQSIFVGVPGLFLDPSRRGRNQLQDLFAVSRGLVPVCHSAEELVKAFRSRPKHHIAPHELRAARVVPHATQRMVDAILGHAGLLGPPSEIEMDQNQRTKRHMRPRAKVPELSVPNGESFRSHHRVEASDKEFEDPESHEWAALKNSRTHDMSGFFGGSFWALLLTGVFAAGGGVLCYQRSGRCRRKTHPL